jgi:hypothetical protein
MPQFLPSQTIRPLVTLGASQSNTLISFCDSMSLAEHWELEAEKKMRPSSSQKTF